MPRQQILSTVPADVRAIAEDRARLEKQDPAYPAIALRLVSYRDMNGTWALVSQHKRPDLPTIFFDLVLRLRTKWQNQPKAPTRELEANVERIASLASALAAALAAHDAEIDLILGQPLTFHHVMVGAREIRNEAMHGSQPRRGLTYALRNHLRPVHDRLRDPYPTLPEFLESLAAELRPSRVSGALAIRPTRVADHNAERTWLVRWMTVFFQSRFGEPRFDLVAATVNTLLDDPDCRLDASHARKLAPDLL